MRKIKLTSVQDHILQILRKAGEESLATIEATLQSQGKGEERLDDALEALESLGFVSRTDADITLTESGVYALTH